MTFIILLKMYTNCACISVVAASTRSATVRTCRRSCRTCVLGSAGRRVCSAGPARLCRLGGVIACNRCRECCASTVKQFRPGVAENARHCGRPLIARRLPRGSSRSHRSPSASAAAFPHIQLFTTSHMFLTLKETIRNYL